MQDSDKDMGPMDDPDEQPSSSDGTPKFGRLLLVLALSVAVVVALTWGSMAYYT